MNKTKTTAAGRQDLLSRATARVLIVDDHELVRNGLRLLVGRDPELEVCGEAANEAEGRAKVRQLKPDVVIVDLTLNQGNGLDLIKWIKEHNPEIDVIVSTMHDEKVYGERTLRAGASGFVNKQDSAPTILSAIRQVRSGKLYFSEDLTQRIMHRAATGNKEPVASPVDVLSDRELEVFRMIGAGRTSRQISAALRLAPSTVETYRERLKMKLNLSNGAELAQHATMWVLENR